MTAALKFVQSDRATAARTDIDRMLKRIGCNSIEFVDDIEKCELRLSFQHNNTHVVLPISAQTWTGIFLRLRPWTSDKGMSEQHYRENAARQGLMAISPMVKTWLFGQVVAVENGLVPFEVAFFPGIQCAPDVVAKIQPRR
jgi:hypothetical protein